MVFVLYASLLKRSLGVSWKGILTRYSVNISGEHKYRALLIDVCIHVHLEHVFDYCIHIQLLHKYAIWVTAWGTAVVILFSGKEAGDDYN